MKPAEFVAEVTTTDDGTLRVGLLLVRLTVAPPEGAGPFSVTVHVEVPELFKVDGAQDREVTLGNAPPVTTPPVGVTAIPIAAAEAATAFVTPIEVLLTPTAMVRFTTATGPLAIRPAFIPEATQLYVPVLVMQVSVLPAALVDEPVLTAMEATLLGG